MRGRLIERSKHSEAVEENKASVTNEKANPDGYREGFGHVLVKRLKKVDGELEMIPLTDKLLIISNHGHP